MSSVAYTSPDYSRTILGIKLRTKLISKQSSTVTLDAYYCMIEHNSRPTYTTDGANLSIPAQLSGGPPLSCIPHPLGCISQFICLEDPLGCISQLICPEDPLSCISQLICPEDPLDCISQLICSEDPLGCT